MVVKIHPVTYPGIIFLPAKILQLRHVKDKLESDAAEHHTAKRSIDSLAKLNEKYETQVGVYSWLWFGVGLVFYVRMMFLGGGSYNTPRPTSRYYFSTCKDIAT